MARIVYIYLTAWGGGDSPPIHSFLSLTLASPLGTAAQTERHEPLVDTNTTPKHRKYPQNQYFVTQKSFWPLVKLTANQRGPVLMEGATLNKCSFVTLDCHRRWQANRAVVKVPKEEICDSVQSARR